MKYPDEFINQVVQGDCVDVMKQMPENSIDTIITDPPYGLEFMGKEWDKFGVSKARAKRLLGSDNKGTGDRFFYATIKYMWTYFRKSEGRYYIKWRNKGSRTIHSKRRAVFMWEEHNGKLEKGFEVHHKNLDKADDRIENLIALPRKKHRWIHGRIREDHKRIDGKEHRRCQKCREYKPLDNFQKRSAGTYQGYCKECQRKSLQEWRDKNRDKHNKYHREYRKQNKICS